MSKKVLYECMKCGKTYYVENMKDGLGCYECKGGLRPLGYVDEIKKSISAMQGKLDKADNLTKKKEAHILTIKLNLDTTDMEEKLDRLTKKLEHINNRYTIQPQELSKRMEETLTKAIETLSLMTKDLMNRNKEV